MGLFIKICLLGFLTSLSYFLARYPIIPLFAESLNLSPEQIGLVVSASSISGVLFKMHMGTLSDIWGRKKLLIIAGCCFAITPFFYYFAKDLKSLFLFRLIHGLATAIFAPVVSAFISDIANRKNRGRLLSSYSSISMVGEMLGPFICGWLIFWSGFFLPFLASGIAGICALFVTFGIPKDIEKKETITHKKKRIRFIEGLHQTFLNKSVLIVSLVECGQLLANGALECFLPIYAKNHIYLSSWEIGVLFAISGIATVFFKPFWGTLSDLFGRKLQISLGLVLGGISYMLVPFSHSFLIIFSLIALYGFSIAIVTSATSPYITDLVNKERYGAAHGIFGTITDIGHASGSIIGGVLISHFNYDVLFFAFGGFLIVFGLLFRFVIGLLDK